MSGRLTVHSLCYYLTEVGSNKWRPADYTARDIVKIAKGESFGGHFDFSLDGKKRRFNHSNAAEFLPILYYMLAKRLSALVSINFTLVPIPNSSVTRNDISEFLTYKHAKAIAKEVGPHAHVCGGLRWKRAKPKVHKTGGSRDPEEHFNNLCLTESPKRPVVLFDDMVTTGSQMIGAARRLANEGHETIFGIVVGRRTKEQESKMLGWSKFNLDLEDDDPLF